MAEWQTDRIGRSPDYLADVSVPLLGQVYEHRRRVGKCGLWWRLDHVAPIHNASSLPARTGAWVSAPALQRSGIKSDTWYPRWRSVRCRKSVITVWTCMVSSLGLLRTFPLFPLNGEVRPHSGRSLPSIAMPAHAPVSDFALRSLRGVQEEFPLQTVLRGGILPQNVKRALRVHYGEGQQ